MGAATDIVDLVKAKQPNRPVIDLNAEINAAFKAAYFDEHRFLILYGGAGSGKSHFAAQKMLLRVLQEPGHKILFVRKVARTLRHSVFALFLRLLDRWHLRNAFRVNRSDLTFEYLINGNTIICVGLDDPEKLKSIDGITGIWVEEPTELTEADLTQLDLRLRGETKHYKQIVLSYNPISATHWLKKRFHDVVDTDTTVIKTTVDDNAFIDAEYVRVLDKLKDQSPVLYDVYRRGEWGTFEGLIYRIPAMSEFPPTDKLDEIIYGLDFGFNNPCALIRVGLQDVSADPVSGTAYLDEQVYESGLTTAEIASEMTRLEIPYWMPVYADAADPGRIQELCNAGFNVMPAAKGQGSVQHGIATLQALELHVTPGSVNLISEFESYTWRKDKDGNSLDAPVDYNNHGLDAARYGIATHLSEMGAGVQVGRLYGD